MEVTHGAAACGLRVPAQLTLLGKTLLNRVLDAVAESELELRITVTNEAMMMSGLQKVADRISIGLVLAALILGAAMPMSVDTSFRILGYPGLAMLLFLGAAVGGIGLVVDVVRHDWRSRTPRI